MLRGETDIRKRYVQIQDGRDNLLRKITPFVLAFLSGFLLAKRRHSSESAEEAEREQGDLTDAQTQVRQRMAPGGTKSTADEGKTDQHSFVMNTEQVERQAKNAGEEQNPDGTRAVDVPTTSIDADVANYSPSSTHGMPMLGLGTYNHADYDSCYENVQQALHVGYRHIDTTEQVGAYYNEEAVGDAVAASSVARENLFVATKVPPADLDQYGVRHSAEESLDRLGMEYLDLLYVHWPTGKYDPVETLDAFTALREEGLIEEIGVSNFTVDLLEEAIDVADAPIFANQVEMHPLFPQEDLREFCAQDHVDVELVAYSPIARDDVEHVTEIQEVARKHGATPEQVSLAWLREKNVTAIPRATTKDHIRENWLSLALELDDEDVAKLDAIEERERIVDPDDAPWH